MSLTIFQEPVVLSLKLADIAERDWPGLLDCLSPDERVRTGAFHHLADRQSYIAAHALLRLSLAPFLGSHPARFVSNAYGKPCFAPDDAHAEIGFNISHCRGMVVVGLARGLAIGVDTEPLDRLEKHDVAAVARSLSGDEQALLAARHADDRHACLLDLWTLKESVIKATGQGLSLDLASFSVDPAQLSIVGLDGVWRLARWDRDGYRVALALLGEPSLPPRHLAVEIIKQATGLEVIGKSQSL